MRATAIRFTDEEKDWIKSCADFMGESFSEFVRKSSLERVEEAADLQAYREALAEDDGVTYSMEEVMRMAMMGE
ncbi:DUF6290 family protein [Collinsella sp. AGMB00827]|uniref:DUF6290 family protein n=2 Tax=Collinsella ureilytica TaxID=2869515 RepID=A0ABS7MKD5_9ACTN|nr:DUF6290 family protein [Collinsella urealyticum]